MGKAPHRGLAVLSLTATVLAIVACAGLPWWQTSDFTMGLLWMRSTDGTWTPMWARTLVDSRLTDAVVASAFVMAAMAAVAYFMLRDTIVLCGCRSLCVCCCCCLCRFRWWFLLLLGSVALSSCIALAAVVGTRLSVAPQPAAFLGFAASVLVVIRGALGRILRIDNAPTTSGDADLEDAIPLVDM
jgi:hypothetical protein